MTSVLPVVIPTDGGPSLAGLQLNLMATKPTAVQLQHALFVNRSIPGPLQSLEDHGNVWRKGWWG